MSIAGPLSPGPRHRDGHGLGPSMGRPISYHDGDDDDDDVLVMTKMGWVRLDERRIRF